MFIELKVSKNITLRGLYTNSPGTSFVYFSDTFIYFYFMFLSYPRKVYCLFLSKFQLFLKINWTVLIDSISKKILLKSCRDFSCIVQSRRKILILHWEITFYKVTVSTSPIDNTFEVTNYGTFQVSNYFLYYFRWLFIF